VGTVLLIYMVNDVLGASPLMKLLALQFKKPLILLPQTYGPFQSESNKKIASEIVKKAKYAWARDSRSYAVLKKFCLEILMIPIGIDVVLMWPLDCLG